MAAHQVVRLRPLTFWRSDSDDFSHLPAFALQLAAVVPTPRRMSLQLAAAFWICTRVFLLVLKNVKVQHSVTLAIFSQYPSLIRWTLANFHNLIPTSLNKTASFNKSPEVQQCHTSNAPALHPTIIITIYFENVGFPPCWARVGRLP